MLGELRAEETVLNFSVRRRQIGQSAVHIEGDAQRNHWSTDLYMALYSMVSAEFRLFNQAPESIECNFPQCIQSIA